MAEYIEKSSVLKTIDDFVKDNREYGFSDVDIFDIEMMKKMIRRIPAADVATIVRCRDCKYFNQRERICKNDDVYYDLEGGAQYRIGFGTDDFCSYGERRE